MTGLRRVVLFMPANAKYWRDIAQGAARAARAHDVQAIHISVDNSPLPDLGYWNPSAIVTGVMAPWIEQHVARANLPTVNVSSCMAHSRWPSVVSDNDQIGRLAATYFLERGYHSFGYCGIDNHHYSDTRERGFRNELEAAGYTVATLGSRHAAGTDALPTMAKWVASLPTPLAVLGATDLRGARLLEACGLAGRHVPEEVAVVGVDNDELICEMTVPPLSSVDVNANRIGYEALEAVLKLLDGARPQDVTRLIPPLGVVTRQSSDALATADADVVAAVQWIRANVARGIEVKDVAEATLVSRRTLERRFTAALGRSPADEIRRVKVARAKQLLAETSQPIEQIARAAGFRYLRHLAMVFRRDVGMTPTEYRKQMRG